MTTRKTITVEALDADRLTAIIESRMSRDLAWLRDDGKTVDRFGPEQVAWALAHLYQTGDVVSGLPALPAEPAGTGLREALVRIIRTLDSNYLQDSNEAWLATRAADVVAIARAALAATPGGEST